MLGETQWFLCLFKKILKKMCFLEFSTRALGEFLKIPEKSIFYFFLSVKYTAQYSATF